MPPNSSESLFASPADLAACRAALRAGSRTFYMASLLLPWRVRDPAMALYAFCRLSDDAIDLADGGADALARVSCRLERICAGRPHALPIDRAFADVMARFAIPAELPRALFEGFAWDEAGLRYETIEDLQAYAARVAGSVGAMMALLMGATTPDALSRACDLGVAMQLTNIARDVGEDARGGRLYLPLRWLAEAGVDAENFLRDPLFTPALGSVVARLLSLADVYYARAESGIALLPRGCRPGIRAAAILYRDIGRVIAEHGFDSVSQRAYVPGLTKLARLAQSLLKPIHVEKAAAAPLREVRFLLDAVAVRASSAAGPAPTQISSVGLPFIERIVWVMDLFSRLERRPQTGRL